jgi:hypothetical protein
LIQSPREADPIPHRGRFYRTAVKGIVVCYKKTLPLCFVIT